MDEPINEIEVFDFESCVRRPVFEVIRYGSKHAKTSAVGALENFAHEFPFSKSLPVETAGIRVNERLQKGEQCFTFIHIDVVSKRSGFT